MESIQLKKDITTESLVQKKISDAMTYEAFRSLMDELADRGMTTGSNPKESYVDYTNLNRRRMKRWDRTFKIPSAVQKKIETIDQKVHWLVLTESWCGDAAPTLPVMNKIAELNPNIKLSILLRDEHMDLMELFRTEGSLSIPKLIAVDEGSDKILGEWGPRPSIATELAKEYKQIHGSLSAEFKEDLQRWYNEDKGQNTLDDLVRLLALE